MLSTAPADGNFKLKGLLGFDMYGKTAGLIGMGRIAKELIKILRGFGMNVLAYDLYPDHEFAKQHDVKVVELDELYAQSDIISLHCPLTPETKHIINTESIAKMKPGVMIINTGRGQLINTETSSRDCAPNALVRPVSTCTKKRKTTSTKTAATR